jgi:hypothetical protein
MRNDMTSAMASSYDPLMKTSREEEIVTPIEPPKDPLQGLAGRCTGTAWDALRDLRGHPRLSAIVAALAAKKGTIFEYDVENALDDVLRSFKG